MISLYIKLLLSVSSSFHYCVRSRRLLLLLLLILTDFETPSPLFISSLISPPPSLPDCAKFLFFLLGRYYCDYCDTYLTHDSVSRHCLIVFILYDDCSVFVCSMFEVTKALFLFVFIPAFCKKAAQLRI